MQHIVMHCSRATGFARRLLKSEDKATQVLTYTDAQRTGETLSLNKGGL